MFDIGFWELVVVAVVALLVIGPNELPNMIRTVGAVVGKARRFVKEAKADLNEEIRKVDELKHLIAKEANIAELHKNIDIDSEQPNIPIKRSSSQSKGDSEPQAITGAEKPVTSQSPGSSGQPQPPHGSAKE